MMLQSVLTSLALAGGASAAAATTRVLVPELTGPHEVGTTVLELIDYGREDPFAPTPQPRDLLISLYYPTEDTYHHRSGGCKLAPQFPPKQAAYYDAVFNSSAPIAELLTTRSCVGAPLTRPDLPLLLFGPGLGTSRQLYADFAGEMASHGWNVVTVDHPYDTDFIEYPDGRVVQTSDSPAAQNATLDQFLDVRVQDLIFVLDALANSSVTSLIPGLGGDGHSGSSGGAKYPTGNPTPQKKNKLRTDKVGCLGHSFGGAASLQLMSSDALKRCVVGSNLDGGLYGPVVQQGTNLPFLFFGRADHTLQTDDTWTEAWKHLTGFKRMYAVTGILHADYSDIPLLDQALGSRSPDVLKGLHGNLTGTRMLEIQTGFLGALFGRFLEGEKGALLDEKVLKGWPEVTRLEA